MFVKPTVKPYERGNKIRNVNQFVVKLDKKTPPIPIIDETINIYRGFIILFFRIFDPKKFENIATIVIVGNRE